MSASAPGAAANETLAIVGVGLIGGSIGLAARRCGKFGPILGVGRDRANLARARALGCIDEAAANLAGAAKRADVIVFCTPVNLIAEQVLTAAAHCRPGTFLTDAGSAKAAIVAALEPKLPAHVHFVGAHPLAGSEKHGPEHARADLFDNHLTVITPTARADDTAVARSEAFWRALGSRVRRMTPDEHDRAVAATSHLPHLVAAALAGTLPPHLHELVASGFRDTTRVAAGDPELWTAIFLQNRGPLSEAAISLQARFMQFRMALMNGDGATLTRLLTEAKKVRDDLGS